MLGKRFVGSDYGLLQIEAGPSTSWNDPGSEDSQLKRSQGLKGDLSLDGCFLRLHNSLLSDILASFISVAPDCWFVPTRASNMQWRLWLKDCLMNMTRSLFASLQPWFIDCYWFVTRVSQVFLALCQKNHVTIVVYWINRSTVKRHFLSGSKQWRMSRIALSSVWDWSLMLRLSLLCLAAQNISVDISDCDRVQTIVL